MMCLVPTLLGISNAHMVEVVTENQTKLAEDIIRQSESDVILSCVDPYYGPSPAGYYDALSEAAKSGKKVVHFSNQFSEYSNHECEEMKWHNGRGNISFMTNDDAIARTVNCLLYTSPSPRDQRGSRMPSSA